MEEIKNERSKEQAILLLRKKFGDYKTAEKQSSTQKGVSCDTSDEVEMLKKDIQVEKQRISQLKEKLYPSEPIEKPMSYIERKTIESTNRNLKGQEDTLRSLYDTRSKEVLIQEMNRHEVDKELEKLKITNFEDEKFKCQMLKRYNRFIRDKKTIDQLVSGKKEKKEDKKRKLVSMDYRNKVLAKRNKVLEREHFELSRTLQEYEELVSNNLAASQRIEQAKKLIALKKRSETTPLVREA